MFFDNKHYYNYINRCREHGINAPILPGLKPLSTKGQLTNVPKIFNVEVPIDLYKEMIKAKNEAECEQIGTEWLLEQCRDLLKNNCPVLHFYTISKPNIIYNVLKKLL